MIKIAIQKSGRLSEDSIGLLRDCGIKVDKGMRQLITKSQNFPLEILFLRDDDIPQYVEDGVADIGIVGENTVIEKNNIVTIAKKLGFSKCRLSLAIPKSESYQDISYFNDKKIATSYPRILKIFLKENQVNADIHIISGSVEIAPNIGLADGILDIVSSGSTLFSNGLKEVETVIKSEAVLIQNNQLDTPKTGLLEQLLFRIDAVLKAKDYKYILLNAPNNQIEKIIDLLPGMKSPTVLPLAEENWSSVHSVVHEKQFWEIIDQLKELGAEGILVVPIEKMVI